MLQSSSFARPSIAQILNRTIAAVNALQSTRVSPLRASAPAPRRASMVSGSEASLRQADLNETDLQPASLWKFFEELSAIPRPSKHEGRVLDWLKAFADEHSLAWQQDAVGNMVIKRPGSGGGESAAPVIIQGHIDMVTEKNADTEHDFHADPIRLVRDGDWVTADGTTLGADNGIGVAAALAVLDLPGTAKLPPIEALFTVDEETGLTGAFGLDGSMLSGRTLVNLDTEEWPGVFIGCAGGGDSVLTLELGIEALPRGAVGVLVQVAGLMGGHSGINIHEDRGNAVKMAAAVVEAALEAVPRARLAWIEGGDKRNAIPREARALLSVPHEHAEEVRAVVARVEAEFQAEFGAKEVEMRVGGSDVAPNDVPPTALTPAEAERMLTLISALPHGVIKHSHSVPGLVETSSNLASVVAVVREEGHSSAITAKYRMQCSTRSTLMPALERTRGVIRRMGALCGAEVEQDVAYPGWAPEPDAEVVRLTKEAIAEVAGCEPEVKAIHAGLECGIIGEKLPGCQSVSYGPTITGAHSPDERVQISTVAPFFEATLRLLDKLADKKC